MTLAHRGARAAWRAGAGAADRADSCMIGGLAAGRSVRDQPMKTTDSGAIPKVFLSFSTEHQRLVEAFRDQAKHRDSGLLFRDYSIKEPVPGAWRREAERLIRDSAVTICLVGDSTWRSKPVDWEIRKSAELGKRVLAVYLQSNAVRTPPALLELGVTPLPWDVGAIVNRLHDEGGTVG